MGTILLRLAGPLQSWGSDSKFSRRTTNHEPTKSGVVGLIACALGRSRTDAIDDLAVMKFGLRVDQPGMQMRDFHMAHKEWGSATSHTSFLSERYYLSDAIFLVGFEAGEAWLQEIDIALRNPRFPLFLGRRSCPPAGPVSLGVREGTGLIKALSEAPWTASKWYKKRHPNVSSLEIFFDADIDIDANIDGEYLQRDYPVSFGQDYRKHDFRRVKRSWVPNPNFCDVEEDSTIYKEEQAESRKEATAFHDPMEAI
jgi:CRISPR system Cascade subunit CasD